MPVNQGFFEIINHFPFNKKSAQNLCALFRSLLVLVIHLVLEIRVSVVRVISLVALVALVIALVAVGAVGVLVVRLVRPRVVAIAILIVLHYKLPPFSLLSFASFVAKIVSVKNVFLCCRLLNFSPEKFVIFAIVFPIFMQLK